MTTVVKVTRANRDELRANPLFTWVGRPCGRLGMKGSLFGNPWVVGMMWNGQIITAGEAVRKFDRLLEPGNPDMKAAAIRANLYKLRGRVLGCVCCDYDGHGEPSKPCHAVSLARAVDAMELED